MFNLVDILTGILLVLLFTVLLHQVHVEVIVPNAAVIMTAHAGLKRDLFSTLLTALVVGLFTATAFAGMGGPSLLALLPVAFASQWARHQVQIGTTVGQAGWAVAMVLLHDLAFVALTLLFLAGVPVGRALVRISPLNALVSGLVALALYWALDRIEPLIQARRERVGGVIR